MTSHFSQTGWYAAFLAQLVQGGSSKPPIFTVFLKGFDGHRKNAGFLLLGVTKPAFLRGLEGVAHH